MKKVSALPLCSFSPLPFCLPSRDFRFRFLIFDRMRAGGGALTFSPWHLASTHPTCPCLPESRTPDPGPRTPNPAIMPLGPTNPETVTQQQRGA